MNLQSIGTVIQLIVAPVVMVTSCAILIGGMLTQYAALNDRLRAMTRERLELLRTTGDALSVSEATATPYHAERLKEIDTQLPWLLHRHRIVHNAVLMTYTAILLLVVSMGFIAAAALAHSAFAASTALLVFLGGAALMGVGLVLIAEEIRMSHRAVSYETERVLRLGGDSPPLQRP